MLFALVKYTLDQPHVEDKQNGGINQFIPGSHHFVSDDDKIHRHGYNITLNLIKSHTKNWG
jgi:hypothetical protein